MIASRRELSLFTSTVDEIPPEIKVQIFRDLPVTSQIAAFQVCKQWKEIFEKYLPELQRKITLDKIMQRDVFSYLTLEEKISSRAVCRAWCSVFEKKDSLIRQKLKGGNEKRLSEINKKIKELEKSLFCDCVTAVMIAAIGGPIAGGILFGFSYAIALFGVVLIDLIILLLGGPRFSQDILEDTALGVSAIIVALYAGCCAFNAIFQQLESFNKLNELKAERTQILEKLSKLTALDDKELKELEDIFSDTYTSFEMGEKDVPLITFESTDTDVESQTRTIGRHNY